MLTYKFTKFQNESNQAGVKRAKKSNPVPSTSKQMNSIPGTSKQVNLVFSTPKTPEIVRSPRKTAGKQADDEQNQKRTAQDFRTRQVFMGIIDTSRDFLEFSI